MENLEQILMKCPIFKGLSAEQILVDINHVSSKLRTYQPSDIIARSEEECRFLYIILDGKVKGEMTDYSGKVIRIEELETGKPLAPAFIFGNNNQYPVDIIALVETTVLVIPKEALLKLFQLNQTVLNNYLGLISNRAQFLTSRIRFLSFQTIKGKIAHLLMQQSKKAGKKSFDLNISHHQMSEIFGVTRPSLTRALREMNNDGIIKADGKHITITDELALKGLIQ